MSTTLPSTVMVYLCFSHDFHRKVQNAELHLVADSVRNWRYVTGATDEPECKRHPIKWWFVVLWNVGPFSRACAFHKNNYPTGRLCQAYVRQLPIPDPNISPCVPSVYYAKRRHHVYSIIAMVCTLSPVAFWVPEFGCRCYYLTFLYRHFWKGRASFEIGGKNELISINADSLVGTLLTGILGGRDLWFCDAWKSECSKPFINIKWRYLV